MSAHNCGCDPEAKWQCADYPSCSYGKVLALLQAGVDAINNDDTLDKLVFGEDTMSELTDVGASYEDNGGPNDLTLNDYQRSLHTYKDRHHECHALGLVGELGEVLEELAGAMAPLYVDGKGADIERAVDAVKAAARIADMVKKATAHAVPLDREKLKKELGDVLWYVTAVASDNGLTLGDIAVANIAKLRARYPNGFEKGGGVRADVSVNLRTEAEPTLPLAPSRPSHCVAFVCGCRETTEADGTRQRTYCSNGECRRLAR